MEDKCLNCGEVLQHEKGKRKKVYCSDTCRSSYWFKNNKEKKGKFVLRTKYEELLEEVKELKTKINYKPVTKESYDAEPQQKYIQDELGQIPPSPNTEAIKKHNAAIEAKIDAVYAEAIPPHRNTSLGRRAWEKEQNDKVTELRKQLLS